MNFWYRPKGEKTAFVLGFNIAGWTGFCGGAIAHSFLKRDTFNRDRYGWDESNSFYSIYGTKNEPVTEQKIIDVICAGTRGVIILADRKGGVADKYIFPLFPTDGKEFTAGSLLCTAVVSDYYINRNTRHQVRHVIVTTKTKPRAKRKEKEARS